MQRSHAAKIQEKAENLVRRPKTESDAAAAGNNDLRKTNARGNARQKRAKSTINRVMADSGSS